ncbi:hypothetical protein ACFY4I_39235 [Streptomyces scabiei]|uniref:hypothetical protein n=1 Tax=Streptomyces scabiei TaxID=1930 RepID=UPI00367E5905
MSASASVTARSLVAAALAAGAAVSMVTLPTSAADHARPEKVERLKGAVRRSLGQQLDQFGAADLGVRVDELAEDDLRLRGERDEAMARTNELAAQLGEVEDDLATARTSLRRMVRAENQEARP